MKFGITARFGSLLAAVSVLAAAVSSFYAYQSGRAMLEQSAMNEMLTTTRVLSRRIASTRAEVSRNLQVMANHPAALLALQPSSEASAAKEQLATLAQAIMAVNPNYFQVRLIAAADHGLEIVRLDRADQQLVRVLGEALQEKGHFSYVSGTLGLQSGETYLSRIAINRERGVHTGLGQPTVILATPVLDTAGTARGVVVVNLDLRAVFRGLTADLPADYELYLTNAAGDFLIHPDPAQTFGFEQGRRILLQDQIPDAKALIQGGVDTLVTSLHSDTLHANARVAAFLRQKTAIRSEDQHLVVGIAQPLQNIVAQADRLGLQTLRLVGGLCLAGVLLAMYLARRVTHPINALSSAVERFTSGQQDATMRAYRDRKDEIGVLARSFGRMQDEIQRQLQQLDARRLELEHLVRHDTLTGLPNRRAFQERLEQALTRAQRSGAHPALLFIDVDHFKIVNDKWGHEVGDTVLQIVAKRLQSTIRKADTVARLAGDEFVVLLENPAHREDIMVIAEKLLEGVQAPIQNEGLSLAIGLSIGISRFPEDGRTAAELMVKADNAMYAAKDAGRNRFRFTSAIADTAATETSAPLRPNSSS